MLCLTKNAKACAYYESSASGFLIQTSNGVVVLTNADGVREPLTADQAEELGAKLIAAADFLDESEPC